MGRRRHRDRSAEGPRRRRRNAIARARGGVARRRPPRRSRHRSARLPRTPRRRRRAIRSRGRWKRPSVAPGIAKCAPPRHPCELGSASKRSAFSRGLHRTTRPSPVTASSSSSVCEKSPCTCDEVWIPSPATSPATVKSGNSGTTFVGVDLRTVSRSPEPDHARARRPPPRGDDVAPDRTGGSASDTSWRA